MNFLGTNFRLLIRRDIHYPSLPFWAKQAPWISRKEESDPL